MGLVLASVFTQLPPLPKEILCPVMKSNTVEVASATKHRQFADYKGRRYYFCCGACPAAFRADPEAFAKNPSLPIALLELHKAKKKTPQANKGDK
ncbi:MAG: YHS domain-containing protein [Armatimonadetes bacterium]|nr:YHS domain-containing protein [Armatimonadota bacterium]